MSLLLTDAQLEEVRQIIERYHAGLILKLVGPEVLSALEAELAVSGEDAALLSGIRDAFMYGQAREAAAATHKTSYPAFKRWVEEHSPKLSEAEELAVTAAQQQAGAHIRHLGAKLTQQLGDLYFIEDQKLRAQLGQRVKDEVAVNVARRKSLGALKKQLRDSVDHNTRDWDRVAITEKSDAMSRGMAERFKEKHGDPWVFKRPEPGACKHCVRLYTGPDGHPRMFRLSALEANGTNVGKKAHEWLATLGPIHPSCMCQLSRMPDGWGFDEEGDMVPGGEFGLREGEAEKSMHAGSLSPEDLAPPAGRRPVRRDIEEIAPPAGPRASVAHPVVMPDRPARDDKAEARRAELIAEGKRRAAFANKPARGRAKKKRPEEEEADDEQEDPAMPRV